MPGCTLARLAHGFLLLFLVQAQESRYTYGEDFFNGPYKHIYPPVDITRTQASCQPNQTSPCPLYIAAIFSFGGSFKSSGAIPGIQLALDQMNGDSSFLPGYKLHYLMMDSQVSNRNDSSGALIQGPGPPPFLAWYILRCQADILSAILGIYKARLNNAVLGQHDYSPLALTRAKTCILQRNVMYFESTGLQHIIRS